ncbi:MAG: hypothetical protein HY902_06160 [Deltaproteobacteria bacterium]|nr:hypothetical protein [Deltaproteobacteria bacterium]
MSSGRWLAAALAGAVLSALLVLAWPRPRPAEPTPTPAEWSALLAGLEPAAQLQPLPDGWRLQPAGQPQCLVDLDATLRAPPAPPTQRDLTCLAWRDQALQTLAKRWPAWAQVRAGTDLPPMSLLDRALLALAALLAGALPVLAAALLTRLDAGTRRGLALVGGLALLLRLAWPWRWTAVYFVYEWLDQARFLDSVPRYGPGALVPWAWALGPLGESPRLVHAVQLLAGCLGAVAWTAAAVRATGRVPLVWWVGLPLAATPVLLRNDVSESMHVPALAALGVAGWAGVEWRRAPSLLTATTLAVGLSYAVLCRADLLPIALLSVAVLTWAAGPAAVQPVRRAPVWWPLAPAALVLALVATAARDRAQIDQLAGNLPQIQRFADELPRHLLHDAVLWRPDWWPVAAWLALLAAVVWLPSRAPAWRWLALLAAAVASLLPSWLDYNETSLPRLQAPAQVLATVALAVLGEQALAARRRLRWALVGLWLLAAIATLPATLRRTVAHDEDDLLAKLVAAAPAPGWLAVRSYADEPARGLHLHWPTWWLRSVGLVPVPVSQVRASLDTGAAPSRPLYLWRSLRCRALPLDHAPPLPGHEQPDCAALARPDSMQPLWQESWPNRGDTPTFAWYGRSPTLHVGLYQWPARNPLGKQPRPR